MPRPIRITLLALASAGFVLMSTAQAQGSYTVGQRLTQEQVQALGTLKAVELNGSTYHLLQTGQSSAGLPFSMLLDGNGAVGQTYHELLIAEQPTATVRQKLGALAAQATAVNYYDHTQLSLMRFATLEQALAALAQARTAMPDAEIGIPITFSRPQLR